MISSGDAVSAILIHFGPADYTRHAAEVLARHCTGHLAEIIVVANGPSPLPRIDDIPRLRVIHLAENRGYAGACNAGARAARGARFFFLNNDIDLDCDVLAPMMRALDADPRIGVIGPALRFRDGRFQLSWGTFPSLRADRSERARQRQMRAGEGAAYEHARVLSKHARDVDWLTGAALLVTRACFERIGGFDERFFFYFEDVDLCRRAHDAGFRVRYEPDAVMVHFLGGSASDPLAAARSAYDDGRLRYYGRYNSRISFLGLKLYLSVSTTIRTLRYGFAGAGDMIGRLCRIWSSSFRPA